MHSVEELQQLPLCHRETIPFEFLDAYGHMNVRFYFQLWERGAQAFMAHLGLDITRAMENGQGNWVLKQVVEYLAEVREGQTVTVYGRLIGHSPKRLHNKYWMVNEDRGVIAATSEVLVTCADLNLRKTTPYPPEIAERIASVHAEMDALPWAAETSGVIRP